MKSSQRYSDFIEYNEPLHMKMNNVRKSSPGKFSIHAALGPSTAYFNNSKNE